jgi:multiple sugar transport system ATP-binding protein
MVHFAVDAPAARVADQDTLDEIEVAGGTAIGIGRFSPRSNARAGETVEIAVDCSRLHFFDATSGLAI